MFSSTVDRVIGSVLFLYSRLYCELLFEELLNDKKESFQSTFKNIAMRMHATQCFLFRLPSLNPARTQLNPAQSGTETGVEGLPLLWVSHRISLLIT